VHMPYDAATAQALMCSGEAPTAIDNNCSGKHAGILALCKAIGADPASYLEVDNPAQKQILALCARLSDDDPATWPLGVDGCGIPVYAKPLRRAALAFARLATLEGLDARDAAALQVVRDAMIAFPEYVSGSHEFDAELMRTGAGNLASKSGAEGVHGVACIREGLGYTSKIVDGAGRARPPVTVATLAAVGVLDPAQVKRLASFARPVVYNRAGRAVGEVRARIVAVEKAR
jgi:L-asparaginase II